MYKQRTRARLERMFPFVRKRRHLAWNRYYRVKGWQKEMTVRWRRVLFWDSVLHRLEREVAVAVG